MRPGFRAAIEGDQFAYSASDRKLQFAYPIKLDYFLGFRGTIQVSGCTQAYQVAYLKYRVAVRGNWLAGGALA